MPELPEVETIRRGIAPALQGQSVTGVIVRQPRLRWPVPAQLEQHLCGQACLQVTRRAKYLLLRFDAGTMMVHLGMSGVLRLVPIDEALKKHDHVDINFEQICLRYNDTRRFGSIHWIEGEVDVHPLIRNLGPEPLSAVFTAQYLYDKSRRYRQAIKPWLSNQRIVVGVGNIYASEALFMAKVAPTQPVCELTRDAFERIVVAIQQRLQLAIEQGGTTLKDFQGADGKPGYFAQSLAVYGRDGKPCLQCGDTIAKITQVGRSSFYCPSCQKP